MRGPSPIQSAPLSLVRCSCPGQASPRCLFAPHTWALVSPTSPWASEWDMGLPFTISSNQWTALPAGWIVPVTSFLASSSDATGPNDPRFHSGTLGLS